MTWLNPINLRAGIANLKDEDFVRASRRRNSETKRFALSEMDKLKLDYAASHANFFWLKVGAANRVLPAKLAKSNIYINGLNPRPLESDWERVTIGTTEEMQAFCRAMQSIFKN